MEPIRLIAMDMDGTLLWTDHRSISPACQAALRDALAAGIRLAVVSGRLPDDIAMFTHILGIDTAVLGLNGTALLHGFGGKVELLATLPTPTARAILDMLRGTGRVFTIFSGNDVLVTKDELTQEDIAHLCGTHFGCEGSRCRAHAGYADVAWMLDQGVCKFVLVDKAAPGLLHGLRDQLLAAFPDIEITESSPYSIEINPLGRNKGSGLTALAASLNIPMSQVMALGDGGNDAPMLACAGYGVAMGDACQAAIDASGWQTLSNAEDGVAAAIRQLALREGGDLVVPLR